MNRILLPALVLAVSLPSAYCSGREPDQPVPVTVTFTSGPERTYEFGDRELEFDTIAGEVSFRLHELKSIEKHAKNSTFVVTTVHGDTWPVESVEKPLRHFYIDEEKELPLSETAFNRIDIVPVSPEDWTPVGQMKVFFNDENRALIDVRELTLDVKNESGSWRLPLGSARALRFSESPGSDDIIVTVKFPSSRTESFLLTDKRPHLDAVDTFNNRIRIRHEDSKGIIGRLGIKETPVDSAGEKTESEKTAFSLSQKQMKEVTITSGYGLSQNISLPAIVLKVKGAIGAVLLPSPVLSTIENDRDAPYQTVTTLYGEVFLGKVSPSGIKVPETGEEDRPIRVRDQGSLQFSAPQFNVPEGWLVWSLAGGDVFCARLIKPTFELTSVHDQKQSIVVAVEDLNSIRWADGNVFAVNLKDSTLEFGRFNSRKAELVLLSNGMRCAVPWSKVRSVMRDTTTSLARQLQELAKVDDGTDEGHEPWTEEALPSPRARLISRALKLRSDLAATETGPVPLVRIHSDLSERVSCAETVYGEFFVGPILPSEECYDLLRIDTEEDVPREIPAVLHLEVSSRDVPPGWLAWRLTSGDMFYARIAQETIAVRADSTHENELLLPSDRITSMKQRPDNTFSFRTDTQTIVGRPDERSLSLILLCNTSTCAVPFKLLDCTGAVPLTSLPPPVRPIPGLTPAQQGMVRLEGGPFIMGRTRGEGMHNELPPHEVTLSPFLMDECEITVAQFREFVNDTGYTSDAEKEELAQTWRSPGFTQQDDEPVVCVSWHDAARFCNWRSRKTKLQPCYRFKRRGAEIVSHPERNGFRLPTETEWEYAARSAGKDVIYPWGDETNPEKLVTTANFNPRTGTPRDQWEWTNPVKTFPANNSMLYGMAGNAWEWCQDWHYDKAYSAISRHRNMNPCITFEDVAGLTMRVMRGGSFHNELDMLRCSSRGGGLPRASNTRVGFRCVRTVVSCQ